MRERITMSNRYGRISAGVWNSAGQRCGIPPSTISFGENDNTKDTMRFSFRERVAMQRRVVRFGISVLMLCLCCFCQKGNVSKDSLVKIGGMTVTKQMYEAFDEAKGMFPSLRSEYFSRASDMTVFIAINALYEKAKTTPLASRVKASDDWKWKQMFFPAQAYLKDVVSANFGFSEKDLENHYYYPRHDC
jgi:hypothetical protein